MFVAQDEIEDHSNNPDRDTEDELEKEAIAGRKLFDWQQIRSEEEGCDQASDETCPHR